MTLKYHHPYYTQYTCMPNPVTSCCSVETGTNHLSTLKPPHALAILPSPSLTITNGLAFQVQLLSTHNNRRIPSIPKTFYEQQDYSQKQSKQIWRLIVTLELRCRKKTSKVENAFLGRWLDDETLNINLWCKLNRYLLKTGLKLLLLFCPYWTLKRCRLCDMYSFCVLWMPPPYLQPNLPPGGIGQCNPAMCYWPNPPSSPYFPVAANLALHRPLLTLVIQVADCSLSLIYGLIIDSPLSFTCTSEWIPAKILAEYTSYRVPWQHENAVVMQ